MNDNEKFQQFGAELRLTEEQAKALAERMPQTGVLQVIDGEPLCMARRIEELEAQLAEKSIKVERLREMNLIAMKRVDGMLDRDLELSRLQSLMSEGWQLVPVVPEGWKLEALDNDCIVVRKDGVGFYVASFNAENIASTILHALASDMLAAAPRPEAK